MHCCLKLVTGITKKLYIFFIGSTEVQLTTTDVTYNVPSTVTTEVKPPAPPQAGHHYEDDWEVFDPFYFIKHLPPLTKEQRCRQPGQFCEFHNQIFIIFAVLHRSM